MLKGLFGNCFPGDLKTNLRRKLMTVVQGKTRVAGFIRNIEIMTDRFPVVNERGVIKIF